MSKDAQKPQAGSALTDAVVAALGKIEDDKTAETPEPAPANAEAGCAATRGESAPPPLVGSAPNANGFRNGPGSFADLSRRWSGAAAPAPAAEPVPVEEPPPVEPSVESAPIAAVETKAVGEAAEEDDDEADDDAAAATVESEAVPSEPPAEAAPEESEGPEGPIAVRFFGRTDVGLVREHNEDNFLIAELESGERDPEVPADAVVTPRGVIFAVCDGMGGAAAGEVASQMAVDTILEVMGEPPGPLDRDDFARRLVHAVEEAGHRIFSAAKMDRTRRGMGTTATLAGVVDDMLFVGQVGDSRAYVLRGDRLGMVSKDQSLVNQLIEAGQLTEEEAEAFEHSNIILQALGTTEEVTVDLTFLELRQGDRLMMCSDGLSGFVHAEMIREVLQETPGLDEAAAKLIQMANAGGGHDNITVIVADFDGDGLKATDATTPSYQQYPLPPADDTVRGKSLPPRRDPSMKEGATKPGADVKGSDEFGATGAAQDVPVSSGGGSKIGILAAVALLLVALVAAGWFFFGGGQEMLTGDGAGDVDQPPPPPPPPPPADEMTGDTIQEGPGTEALEIPVEPGVDVEAGGSLSVSSDVSDGHLWVDSEDYGPITDGMTLPLPPGAYSVEARSGDVTLAGPVTVTVTEGEPVPVTLNRPVGQDAPEETPEEPPPVQTPPATGTGGGDSTQGGDQTTPGRRGGQTQGGGGSQRRSGGTRRSGLPTNPF